VVTQCGEATSNTPHHKAKAKAEAEAEAEAIKKPRGARADLKAKDTVETRVKIGVKAEAADGTGATVGPQALIRALEDVQADRSAEAQVRPVQREDINRHLRIKRRTDHGSHHQAA
jgi:hypothetical protein